MNAETKNLRFHPFQFAGSRNLESLSLFQEISVKSGIISFPEASFILKVSVKYELAIAPFG